MFVSSAHTTAATQKWWHCDFYYFFLPLLILSTCVASRPQQLKQQIEQEVLEKDLIIMDHSKLNAMLQRRCRSVFLTLSYFPPPSQSFHYVWQPVSRWRGFGSKRIYFLDRFFFFFFHMRRQGRLICIKVQPVPVCCHDERGQHNEFPYAGHCCDNRFVWLLRSSQQLGGRKKLIQTSAHIVKRGNHYSLIGHTWAFGGGLTHLPPPTTKSRRRRFIQLVSGTPAAARCGSKSFQRTESSRAKKQGVES